EEVARGRRDGDTEDLLELVDGGRRAGAAGDDLPALARVQRLLDRALGLVEEVRRGTAGEAVLGVAVGVERGHLAEVVLDEGEAPARRSEVGVDEEALDERRNDRRG